MDSSSSPKRGVYITAPHTPYYFEDEVFNGLTKDDSAILEERYYKKAIVEKTLISSSSSSSSSSKDDDDKRKSVKSQTQWTRALDAVQEHFSSHVTLDGSSHKLPPMIYALKTAAKHNWVLYKKRECERRKRIRKKIEREKTNEKQGRPANVLMAMVDMCETCKRLYVTVNLFWGVTLCDSCYFNPAVINEIMANANEEAASKSHFTSENIVDEVLRFKRKRGDFIASEENGGDSDGSKHSKKNKGYHSNAMNTSFFSISSPSPTAVIPSSSSYSSFSSPPPTMPSPIHVMEAIELAESIVNLPGGIAEEKEEGERSLSEVYRLSPVLFPPTPSTFCPSSPPPSPPSHTIISPAATTTTTTTTTTLIDLKHQEESATTSDSIAFLRDVLDLGSEEELFSDYEDIYEFSQAANSTFRYNNASTSSQLETPSFSNYYSFYSQSDNPEESSVSFSYDSTKMGPPRS